MCFPLEREGQQRPGWWPPLLLALLALVCASALRFGRPLVPAPGGRRGVTGQKRVQCNCVMFQHSSSWGLTVTPNFGTLGVLCRMDAFKGGCGSDCETWAVVPMWKREKIAIKGLPFRMQLANVSACQILRQNTLSSTLLWSKIESGKLS